MKPSKTMRQAMLFLAANESHRLALRYHGDILYGVSIRGHYGPDHPRQVSVATFRAMQRRGWLEQAGRVHTGSQMGIGPNGDLAMIAESFELLYQLSDTGEKALSQAREE